VFSLRHLVKWKSFRRGSGRTEPIWYISANMMTDDRHEKVVGSVESLEIFRIGLCIKNERASGTELIGIWPDFFFEMKIGSRLYMDA
jgi:hypothetical protein